MPFSITPFYIYNYFWHLFSYPLYPLYASFTRFLFVVSKTSCYFFPWTPSFFFFHFLTLPLILFLKKKKIIVPSLIALSLYHFISLSFHLLSSSTFHNSFVLLMRTALWYASYSFFNLFSSLFICNHIPFFSYLHFISPREVLIWFDNLLIVYIYQCL